MKKQPSTPFGINRYVIAGLYILTLAITGTPSAGTDPIMQLMKLNGAYESIEDPMERISKIASIVGFGLSCCVLSGAATGPLLNILGCKFSSLIGLTLHGLGYSFLFFTDSEILHWASGVCFGFAYQMLMNAHVSVGCLFPNNSSLILAILSAGPDLSLFIPAYMLSKANEGTPVKTLIFWNVAISVGVGFLISLLFLPVHPYVPAGSGVESGAAAVTEETPLDIEENKYLLSTNDKAVNKAPAAKPTNYLEMSAMQQLLTPEFIIFMLFFVSSFCRKKHFITFIRSTFQELEGTGIDTPYSDNLLHTYNTMVPYGFTFAIAWGACVDKFGVNTIILSSGILAIVWNALALVSFMPLQFVTTGIFLLWQSFMFGLAMAYFASVFGFRTLPTLQGLCSCATGLVATLMDVVWPRTITHLIGSFRLANFYILIVAGVSLTLPLLLIFLQNRKAKTVSDPVLGNTMNFERNSISQLESDYVRRSVGLA